MSKVKVEIERGNDGFLTIHVDSKRVCTTPTSSSLATLKHLLEIVFDAMDIENVEVVVK